MQQGDVEQGEQLLRTLWPEAMIISDPEHVLFAHFSLGRGPLGQILGPRTWGAGLRALLKGHFVGRPVGDPLLLPGIFLAQGERVLWSHPFAHIGDLPSDRVLLEGVEQALGATAPAS